MEMNKLTVARGERRGIMGDRRGRGKPRNRHRGLMGMDKGSGIDCGSKGGRAWESDG